MHLLLKTLLNYVERLEEFVYESSRLVAPRGQGRRIHDD
jgi:hypothetical protein